MTSSIYSTKEGIAYQRGNSRTLVEKSGSYIFQVKKGGDWVAGRNRHAAATVEKVKADLGR
jgi:exosome complex RNA-binding protein Csl4